MIPTVNVTTIASITLSSVCLPLGSMLCLAAIYIVRCRHASQDQVQARSMG